MAALIEARAIRKTFGRGSTWRPGARRPVVAVDGVSMVLERGASLGLVGESGSGKSTLARILIGLEVPSAGDLLWDGRRAAGFSPAEWRHCWRKVQYVFQDALSALNPRHTVGEALGTPLATLLGLKSGERSRQIDKLLDRVGLPVAMSRRYPHELSGGQAQRVVLARALAAQPEGLILDEPVSALDVSIQAQIINLLVRLQEELKLSYLFVSHDLAVVEHISDRVAIMYLGKIVEIAPSQSIYNDPRHPYTRALLSAIPIPDPKSSLQRTLLRGDIPNPANPPSGCTFRTRCPLVQKICSEEIPLMKEMGDKHYAACHVV